MDAKITKKRLARMLSYDWIKIVALSVAAIIVWTLVFTMTATRITPAQQFTVFNYYCNTSLSHTNFYNSYEKAFTDGVFSYEVIEYTTNDLVDSGEYASTILEARVATDEGDVIFIPNIGDENTAKTDENGDAVYERTYIQSFFSGYSPYVFDLDEYFADLKTYLDGFYNGDHVNGELDEAKVTEAFTARIKKNKDKRFKKDAEIEQGKKDEIARIRKYRDALMAFNGYLDAGLVSFTSVQLKNENGEVAVEGNYALNLCPDEATMGGLKNEFYYQTTETVIAEDGTKTTEKRNTAKDMHVLFFDMPNTEASFEYESLLYVNYLIELCRTKAA